MRARGFTLVEVVVSLVVLEIGLLAVMGTLLLASRTMTAAETREAAVLEALRVADSLGVVAGPVVPGRHVLPWGGVEWLGPGVGDAGRVVVVEATGDTLLVLRLQEPR